MSQREKRPGMFVTEYDWEGTRSFSKGRTSTSSALAETVLCVLLDSGAQRQFSSVRITLCCESAIAHNVREAWQIKPHPSSPSVVNRVSSHVSELNPSSLPSCHAVFEIRQNTVTRQSADSTPGRLNFFVPPSVVFRLVFRYGDLEESQSASFHTIFDFEHPLPEDTQSVSVSFTSLLQTSMLQDVFCQPMTPSPAIVGRVVRLMPHVPAHDRRTISLPDDILRSIFESFLYPEYRDWRKDIVSSALVCRKWTCALDLLFFDFQSWNQRKSRAELFSFAKALTLRPDLARSIKYLSTEYFTADMRKGFDFAGVPWPVVSGSERNLEMLQQVIVSHHSHYRSALLSLFRVATNIQTLSLSPVLSTTDLLDALRGLPSLESLHAGYEVPTDQILSCLTACPSLKRLFIANSLRAFDSPTGVPSSPPQCSLTEIMISGCYITDAQLRYLISSSTLRSNPTLEHLALVGLTGPSHKTLQSILQTVSKSLVVLQIWACILRVEKEQDFEADEYIPEEFGSREHALDAVILHLERLQILKISPDVATTLILERRARAFETSIKNSSHVLPVIDFTLVHADSPQFKGSTLVEAAERDWPGWAITTTKIADEGGRAFTNPVEFFEPSHRA